MPWIMPYYSYQHLINMPLRPSINNKTTAKSSLQYDKMFEHLDIAVISQSLFFHPALQSE